MKTTLVYFDSIENSTEGFKRSIIAFITLIILYAIILSIFKVKLNYSAGLIALLFISCALAVQENPKSYEEALFYGMCVGLVIYGVFNASNYAIMKWPLNLSIANTFWGIFACGVTSSVIYHFYHKKNI